MRVQVEAKYPADLVSKFYYAKRKLVWEILRDGLKDKIEIQWRNITAIRAIIEDNLPGILEIEVCFSFLCTKECSKKKNFKCTQK
jgi:hypothetical protein